MTLEDIKAIVLQGDPEAKHYASTKRGDYTVWREFQRLPHTSDGVHDGGWKFQIDRFTKAEADSIADNIKAALDAHDNVAYSYLVDYEPDTEFIHHIFDCEAV